MSTTTTAKPVRTSRWLLPESIAHAAAIYFLVTVLHRGLSFARATVFANVLSAAELGLWDMTFGFGLLASPIVVLGLPACLPRFGPRYEQRGQFRAFLRRILRVCLSVTFGLVLVFGLADRTLAAVIYGDPARADLARLAALCLAGLALFDILQTVFHGLRLFRMVSFVHLLLNVSFAALGIFLLLVAAPTAKSVATAHVLSTFAVVAGVGLWLARRLPADDPVAEMERPADFWKRMATYAFWVWAVNALMSLLIYVDRIMLIHWSGQDHTRTLAQLGVYHVFRLVGLLVATLSGVFASIAVPHMGHHWEAGRHDHVKLQLGAFVKVAALGLCAAAVGLLAVHGFLLNTFFPGKYGAAPRLMGAVLTSVTVAGLYCIIGTYLLCLEKPWLTVVAGLCAVAANVVLNALLIPVYQLYGAALATALGTAVGVAVLLAVTRTQGWRFDPGLVVVVAAPLALLLGPLAAGLTFAVVVWMACRPGWLLTAPEMEVIGGQWNRLVSRFRG